MTPISFESLNSVKNELRVDLKKGQAPSINDVVYANVTVEIRGSEWRTERTEGNSSNLIAATDPMNSNRAYSWKIANIKYPDRAINMSDWIVEVCHWQTEDSDDGEVQVLHCSDNPRTGLGIIPKAKTDVEVTLLTIRLGVHPRGVQEPDPDRQDSFRAEVTIQTDLAEYENRTIPIQ